MAGPPAVRDPARGLAAVRIAIRRADERRNPPQSDQAWPASVDSIVRSMPSLASARRHLPSRSGSKTDRSSADDREPAIGLHLGVELARRPAGIAERQQAAPRPLALADRAQDVQRRGHARSRRRRPASRPRGNRRCAGQNRGPARPGRRNAPDASGRAPPVELSSCANSSSIVSDPSSLLMTRPIAPSSPLWAQT